MSVITAKERLTIYREGFRAMKTYTDNIAAYLHTHGHHVEPIAECVRAAKLLELDDAIMRREEPKA